jgi:hypothetical protein
MRPKPGRFGPSLTNEAKQIAAGVDSDKGCVLADGFDGLDVACDGGVLQIFGR